VSQVHRRKPKGKPMPTNVRRGNNTKSKRRAPVEHVFACQKQVMGLCVRSVGQARATTKIGLANLVYNMHRMVQLQRMPVT
ncbi:Transposase DDE domain-containing protein, partial [Pseudovibrio axinellae]